MHPPPPLPSQVPSQVPNQVPSPIPSQMPGQLPTAIPGQFPGQLPGQSPGQFPGRLPAAGWPSGAVLHVRVRYMPLAFLLALFKPKIEIDGQLTAVNSWGTHRFDVAPGTHRVRAWVPYLFLRQMGLASIDVTVAPGQEVSIRWSAPWLVFLPGSWRIEPQMAPAAGPVATPAAMATATSTSTAAAAWHPDPTGRHQQRYWDGGAWTAHVADDGRASVDPI